MRNKGGALWALGLAGAAYVWRNRGRLQQQVSQFSGRPKTSSQLPDYRSPTQYNDSQRNVSETQSQSVNRGPFGNSEV